MRVKGKPRFGMSGGRVYSGKIYGDIKGRFRGGTRIYTSHIEAETRTSTGIIVYTLNSVYFCPFQYERKHVESKRETKAD